MSRKLIRIKSCAVSQWRNHKSFSTEFDSGLNAIVGPNGSGKSSLIMALSSAMFADFEGETRGDVLRKGSPSGPAQSVVHFGHGDDDYAISRSVDPSEWKLQKHKINSIGKRLEPVIGESLVGQAMAALLGIPIKTASRYSFVPQWALYSLVAQTDTDRMKDLYTLFGLSEAEKAEATIKERLISLQPPPVSSTLSEDRATLLDNQGMLRHLKDRIDVFRSYDLDSQVEKYEKMVEAAARLKMIDSRISSIREDYERIAKQRADVGNQKALLEARLNGQRHHTCLLKAAHDEAEGHKQEWENYLRAAGRLDDLDKNIASIQEKLRAISPGKPRENYVSSSDTHFLDDIDALRRVLAADQVFLNAVTEECSTCPVCNNPAPDLFSDRPTHEKNAEETANMIRYLIAAWNESRSYDDKVTNCKKQMEHLYSQLEIASSQREPLFSVKKPDTPIPKDAAASWHLALSDERVIELDLNKVDAAINNLDKQFTACDEEIYRLRKEEDHIRLNYSDDADDARERLEQWKEKTASRAAVMREYDLLVKTTSELEMRLEDDEKARQATEIHQKWREKLLSSSSALSRNGLPFDVAGEYLSRLEGPINEQLDLFATGFKVRADRNSIDFLAEFSNGCLPVHLLSGGQKCLFALTFWLAIASEFGTGFLCLDEPTAGLDSRRISAMREAFLRLRGKSGVQLIVVTHERSLLPAFDRVIELPGQVQDGIKQESDPS